MNISLNYPKQPALRYLLLIAACCLSAPAFCSHAQSPEARQMQEVSTPPADSVVLHFRIASPAVDNDYMYNHLSLLRLERLLSDKIAVSRIDSLSICSYASPDGNHTRNMRLARKRSAAMKSYLTGRYPHLDSLRIRTGAQVSGWEDLIPAIANDPDVPARLRVLEILGSRASEVTKQANLKLLAGGHAYRYLAHHYLPLRRNSAVCTIWMKDSRRFTETAKAVMQRPQAAACPLRLIAAADRETACRLSPYLPEQSLFSDTKIKRPLLALKTNLLFDAALMPNIEIEVPIRKRWSLNGELMFPWWLADDNKYCMQILMGGLEGRYWLGSHRNRENREVLTGHFLGLYAGGGKYDLQWDRNGYQGEFFIAAGISYGYAHKIARNLRLEYNIGIGLLRTNYEHYHALDNYKTLLWQNNGRYTWLGPTKLKISLVWLLNRKVTIQKGGVR